VHTFADQHLAETPDDKLPLTSLKIGPSDGGKDTVAPQVSCLEPTIIRSPFVALSGHSDSSFSSISELCRTVRSGVFLEEAVVPFLPIFPSESTTPLNAYLYDFYKHGDVRALDEANKIRPSEVWFLLNDFSLVLATIVTSLTNFMKLNPYAGDDEFIEVQGLGDREEEQREESALERQEAQTLAAAAAQHQLQQAPRRVLDRDDEAPAVPESWDADERSAKKKPAADEDEWDPDVDGEGLLKVLRAFKMLQTEFNDKFKKMWA
jgi:ATP-dependent RNA helicase DDX60